MQKFSQMVYLGCSSALRVVCLAAFKWLFVTAGSGTLSGWWLQKISVGSALWPRRINQIVVVLHRLSGHACGLCHFLWGRVVVIEQHEENQSCSDRSRLLPVHGTVFLQLLGLPFDAAFDLHPGPSIELNRGQPIEDVVG